MGYTIGELMVGMDSLPHRVNRLFGVEPGWYDLPPGMIEDENGNYQLMPGSSEIGLSGQAVAECPGWYDLPPGWYELPSGDYVFDESVKDASIAKSSVSTNVQLDVQHEPSIDNEDAELEIWVAKFAEIVNRNKNDAEAGHPNTLLVQSTLLPSIEDAQDSEFILPPEHMEFFRLPNENKILVSSTSDLDTEIVDITFSNCVQEISEGDSVIEGFGMEVEPLEGLLYDDGKDSAVKALRINEHRTPTYPHPYQKPWWKAKNMCAQLYVADSKLSNTFAPLLVYLSGEILPYSCFNLNKFGGKEINVISIL